jgi:hypothetical protein
VHVLIVGGAALTVGSGPPFAWRGVPPLQVRPSPAEPQRWACSCTVPKLYHPSAHMNESPPSNPYASCNAYIAQAKMEKDSVFDVEKFDEASDLPLKRDAHGLPLVPRPSDFTDDPLVSDSIRSAQTLKDAHRLQNWPRWRKWSVLLQVSFMAFLGPFNAAVPNPGFVELGKAFDKPVQVIIYSTTIAIITGGVAVSLTPFCTPYLWVAA